MYFLNEFYCESYLIVKFKVIICKYCSKRLIFKVLFKVMIVLDVFIFYYVFLLGFYVVYDYFIFNYYIIVRIYME